MKEFVITIFGDIITNNLWIMDCHDNLIKNDGPESHEHSDFITLIHADIFLYTFLLLEI